MRTLPVCVLLTGLLPVQAAHSAETIGEAEYTYIGANHYQFPDVAANARQLLEAIGIAAKRVVAVGAIGEQRAEEILNAASGYGGVFIYVGHGDNGWVTLEPYPLTTAGFNQAMNRMQFLIAAGRLTAAEVTIKEVTVGTPQAYCVALTNAGIHSNFGGSNAIAVIGACNSGTTAGNWGARVELVYNYACTGANVQADLDVLFRNLTANRLTDFSKMLVAQAMDGTTLSWVGNTATALFPWVTSVTPLWSVPWTTPPTQVVANFGTDMEETSNPFYVGGVGIVKGANGWNSATSAKVDVYYGWQYGNVIVGLDANRIGSSRGIPLYNGLKDYSDTFTCAVNSYPPAASVNAFIPFLNESGGVTIAVDLMSLRGAEALWVERTDGQLVGDTLMVATMSDHRFAVDDPVGTAASSYHLYEREYDGGVFRRASEGVTAKVPVVQSEPVVAGIAERLIAEIMPVEFDAGGPIGLAICPDAFAATAQIYADYWTAAGRPVEVVLLSVSGSTTSELHDYIGQRYAEGVRYVLLVGSASDHLWFDDPTKWPDLPGSNDWRYWFDDYHTPGGYYDFVSQPTRDLVPMWYVADTEYDNMSYWTPYYATDYFYRADYPALRIGRVPAYTDTRFLAWLSKNIAYCESGSVAAWTDDVGIWGQCHSWDGNSGPMMQVLIQDFRNHMPGALNQYALIDTIWTQTQRQTLALGAWNAGRGIIYMLGTSSTAYKPIHFFAKSGGWNVGQLATEKYPLVVGSSCGIGTHDMAIDPTYGDHFAIELLTGSSTRGTPFLVGPSRGTWAEGNRQMVERLNEHVSVTPALDLGTAFMLAQNEVVASSPPEAVQTALSYQFLGDPLVPLPGAIVTNVAAQRPRQSTALLENYPNPFNPSTTVVYTMTARNHVTVKVYDVAGRRVATLVDGVRSAGPHRAVWRPRDLASGVYFCQLQVGSFSTSKKMVLLK